MTKRDGIRGAIVFACFLLLVRGLNIPEEMPYLFWVVVLIVGGLFLEGAYDASKHW